MCRTQERQEGLGIKGFRRFRVQGLGLRAPRRLRVLGLQGSGFRV